MERFTNFPKDQQISVIDPFFLRKIASELDAEPSEAFLLFLARD
jgi:hypothetical protein